MRAMMPGRAVKMSRSNTRAGTGRKPAAPGAPNPLLLNSGARQRCRRKQTRESRHAPAGEPEAMQEVLVDIDAVLDRQTAQDSLDNGVLRRRIEMLREAQLLQQQLADSFDP